MDQSLMNQSFMNKSLEFDAELLRRYDKAGPRYTSYPTAVQFSEGYKETDYRAHAAMSNGSDRALSLYFHLPFCSTICYYCACNKIVTRDRSRAVSYLQRLHKEIALQAELFDRTKPVNQLHWGGGTPTFISHQQMIELMAVTRRHFSLLDDDSGEYSIEIDPREIDRQGVKVLRDIGFNRLSLGVQDFDPAVQKAVNRLQSEALTVSVVDAARDEGFKSVSVDLIYGLPLQTPESFARTLERIVALSPDRISLFNYAHMPDMFKTQRGIREGDLPSPETKLDILRLSIETLTESGYVFIGMDHFAKPDDELAKAQSAGKLYRNFQGYATHADCDLVGLGITAIGTVGNSFAQNVKTLSDYYARIDAGLLPVWRGIEFNDDDRVRRYVIMQLICHFELDIARCEQDCGIGFDTYFADELLALKSMADDGLVTLNEGRLIVTPKGRLLIRNICMVFDRYLRSDTGSGQPRFSKAI